MKRALLAVIVTLFSVLFFAPQIKAEYNRTQTLNSISELLDSIQERLHASILEKHIQVNQSISDLHTDLRNAVDSHQEAKEAHQNALNTAENNYQNALSIAEAEHAKDLEFAAEKERQEEEALHAMQTKRQRYESGKENLQSELEQYRKNVDAEMDLIERVRNMLGILHARDVKRLNEACNDQYGCQTGLECQNHVCKAQLLESCHETSDCFQDSGNHTTCDHGTCRLALGSPCHSSTHCATLSACNAGVCTPLNKPCAGNTDCAGGLECHQSVCKASLRGYTCDTSEDCAGDLQCAGEEHQCLAPVTAPCQASVECAGDRECYQGTCTVPTGGSCSTTSECRDNHECVSGKCLEADWNIGQWDGETVYGVRVCDSGDYECQAREACEQATGSTCKRQDYDCSSYPGGSGSYYPISNPLGRSISTSGSSDLNWAITSALYADDNEYGNLCCCDCNAGTNRQWDSGKRSCGVGVWHPY
eukprot:gb/GECH01007028.1/.p1 GENE.gb/GECH01007028.1/~~gb/GECH01007028.1/.p1  ORF type:complete len:477 (+),score=57.42 gb/GECH01007028.1/:1-1431(+)